MRAFAILLFSAITFPTASAMSAPLDKADYIRCMSYVERISQAAMLKQPRRDDIAKATACTNDAAQSLSDDQRAKLAYVYKLLTIQLEAPSATAHMQLLREVNAFLELL